MARDSKRIGNDFAAFNPFLANPPINPAKRGTNFAWVQHFIHHLAPRGMAGFVLVRFWFWVKLKAARVIKSLDNPTSVRGDSLFD